MANRAMVGMVMVFSSVFSTEVKLQSFDDLRGTGLIFRQSFVIRSSGYFAGPKKDIFPPANTIETETKPKFKSFEEFLKEFGDEWKPHTLNKVKICPNPQCGKPCSYTQDNCNECAKELTEAEVETTENVFMGFIFGVKEGKFPFTISLRAESERFIVFDDLLATAPMHTLIIPTFSWIPDFRHFFLAPQDALGIINEMYQEGLEVMQKQFWNNAAFHKKYWNNMKSRKDMESLVIAGFNYPPSVWQVHMQFLAAPSSPYFYNAMQRGIHLNNGRFFPLAYIKAILKSVIEFPLPPSINTETGADEIIKYFDERHINYNKYHDEELQRWQKLQERCSAYHQNDFTRLVIEDTVFNMKLQTTGEDPKVLQKSDKKALQNYGRPYKSHQAPAGSYYSHAKEPKNLKPWPPAPEKVRTQPNAEKLLKKSDSDEKHDAEPDEVFDDMKKYFAQQNKAGDEKGNEDSRNYKEAANEDAAKGDGARGISIKEKPQMSVITAQGQNLGFTEV